MLPKAMMPSAMRITGEFRAQTPGRLRCVATCRGVATYRAGSVAVRETGAATLGAGLPGVVAGVGRGPLM